MAHVQYDTVVTWDAEMADVGYADADNGSLLKGLAISGLKTTTGAPSTATAVHGHWLPGAIVQNIVDGTAYQMTGSTASPAWSLLTTTTSAFTLPSTESDTTTTSGTSVAWSFTTLTTGIAQALTAAALTTGKIYRAVATAATLTTGRYFEAFDGALAVWGIGANGHMHSLQTTAPTISGVSHGLTPAITAGASDTCGIITTAGTNDAGGDSVITVTFNKTYTAAPKSVQITPLNASASKAAATSLFTAYVSAQSATAFTVTVPSDASAGATPSWSYQVFA